MKRVYLYGIAGADEAYGIVKYLRIEEDRFSIKNIIYDAMWLKMKNPTIEHVYAIDDRGGLMYDYRDAIKRNSIEGFVIFKNILEREGIMVI